MFLAPAGDERIKDKGLNCTYIIARRPENQPTSERAIPCSIFSAEPLVARAWLRKWCGDLGSGEPRLGGGGVFLI
jgi:DNA polymerase epsilon subunit 1